VLNEGGSAYVRGDGEATADTAALDVKTAAEAGPDGIALDAFGASHLFYSAAVTVPAGAEPRIVERILVGAPLVDANVVDEVLHKSGLSGLALVERGKLLQGAGIPGDAFAKLVKDLRPGVAEIIARGATGTMGPLKLPLLTQGDVRGGQAALSWGFREAVPTTPYEVIAVTDLAPGMSGLAAYQRKAVAAFGGLLMLTLVWTALMGGGRAATDEDDDEEETGDEPASDGPKTRPVALPMAPPPEPASALPVQDVPPPPEASPDDFPFGPPSSSAQSDRTTPGVRSPLLDGPPPGPAPAEPVAAAFAPPPDSPFDFDNQPTRAYTLPPSNGALATGAEDFNPDATRVQVVPDELLRASARPSKPEMPAVALPKPPPTAPPPRVASAMAQVSDEQHFQEVYREFLATREKCGEAADGLTFEKFAGKLRKNREQLIQKYSCRTVRFQVYVKEGKAALKATPVKD
jgi:hypothetical protein